MLLPWPPAGAVQPSIASSIGAKPEQHSVPALSTTAPAAAVLRRADRIAVEPLDDTGPERARLGLLTCKPRIAFGDRHPLVEEAAPVFGGRAVLTRPQQRDQRPTCCGRAGRSLQREARGSLENECLAVNPELRTRHTRGLESLQGAHSVALQLFFSGAE